MLNFELYFWAWHWQESKRSKFLLRSPWHKLWLLLLCGVWASLWKCAFLIAGKHKYIYMYTHTYGGEYNYFTQFKLRQIKLATVPCSKTTHYTFRFWKWNSVQKMLSFCKKITNSESFFTTCSMRQIYIYSHVIPCTCCVYVYILTLV